MPHCRSPLQGDQAIGVTGGSVVDVVVVLLVVAGAWWVRWVCVCARADGGPLCVQPAATTPAARTRAPRRSDVRLVDTGPSVARVFPALTSPFSSDRNEGA